MRKTHVTPPPKIRPLVDLIAECVAKPDLVPDYTDLYTRDELMAMQDAYVREHWTADAQAKWLSRDQRNALELQLHDQMRALLAGAPVADPKALGELYWTVEEEVHDAVRWIDEEIVYLLGVEIGRRLSGGGR